ncbi:MAG: hypothetical protein IJP17_05670 [Clostridia bacterium]|nr:hypothetical protein [Clostridia bacterium]
MAQDKIPTEEQKDTGYSLLDTNSEELYDGKKVIKAKKEKKSLSDEETKKRNSRIYILSIVAISVLLAVFVISRMVMTINENLVFELSINETDITSFSDAVYSADYETAHMSASVDVTVIDGKMTEIVLTDYTGIDPERAQVVIDSVIEYQMLNTPDDDIGTQTTDIIVLKAIEETLQGAY